VFDTCVDAKIMIIMITAPMTWYKAVGEGGEVVQIGTYFCFLNCLHLLFRFNRVFICNRTHAVLSAESVVKTIIFVLILDLIIDAHGVICHLSCSPLMLPDTTLPSCLCSIRNRKKNNQKVQSSKCLLYFPLLLVRNLVICF
jgi:hypothetical protein